MCRKSVPEFHNPNCNHSFHLRNMHSIFQRRIQRMQSSWYYWTCWSQQGFKDLYRTSKLLRTLQHQRGSKSHREDRHFDRHMMAKFLPALRTFGIRESLVSLRGKTSTREGFPITPSYNKPIPRPGISPDCQNYVVITRFHVHGQQLIFIHRNGFSHLPDCLNSRSRNWTSCRSVYLGPHQFSPHMNGSLALLYSSISQNLHRRGMTCTDALTCSLTPGRDYAY